MSSPLAPEHLSLTAGGVALISDSVGDVSPDAVEGLFVGDVRVLCNWQLQMHGFELRKVGWQRTGPSADRVLFTISAADHIDPVGLLERRRELDRQRLTEHITITNYSTEMHGELHLQVGRDDLWVRAIGERSEPHRVTPTITDTSIVLDGLGGPATISGVGWGTRHAGLCFSFALASSASVTTTVYADLDTSDASGVAIETPPVALGECPDWLGQLMSAANDDLRALAMPVGSRHVIAAGSPYFLALFGRDSLIAGLQQLLASPMPLVDVLTVLAQLQASTHDPVTRAQPGRILHELRFGHHGVFGVPSGVPYFGAVDTPALFVAALGEAWRHGAPGEQVATLLPAARAALAWCTDYGDVDGDGFIESVPDPGGLVNLHWKDSGDSIIDRNGATVSGSVATCDVQAYWYRAWRTMAELEEAVGTGDGSDARQAADALARRFHDRFVYTSPDGPFVGLALGPDKQLLEVRTSNPGHALWAGALNATTAASVAAQLAGQALFSGWGVRTVADDAAGYNPFGYHRGSVWPHDTAMAVLGMARYGADDALQRVAGGLLDLARANGGSLPELLSGLPRTATGVPVTYAAACRPHAWSAGAPLMVLRALLGFEPNVPRGELRLRPRLPDGVTISMPSVRLGNHAVSFTVCGCEVLHADGDGLTVITDHHAALAATDWAAP
jgi:glycogen debranching enzyme